MKEIVLTLVICLVLTIVLEETVALAVGARKGFDLTVILFTNTLTNPVVVFTGMMLATFTSVPRALYITVLELLVFVVEALIYKKILYCKKPSPFILSLILNSVSFFIGTTLASLILKILFRKGSV